MHVNHPQGLVQTQILSQWVWGGPKMYISKKLLCDADAAGLGTTVSSKALRAGSQDSRVLPALPCDSRLSLLVSGLSFSI